MGWKREGSAKPGKAFIPKRSDLDEANRPAREYAERKRKAARGK